MTHDDNGSEEFTDRFIQDEGDSGMKKAGPATRRFAGASGGSQHMPFEELDRFMGSAASHTSNNVGSMGNALSRGGDSGGLTMTGLVRTNSRVSLVDFTATDIIQHLMSRDDIKSCDYCCIVFGDPAMYYLHRCMHDKMDVRRCNLCGKMATDKYDFMAHWLSQHK
ncbi:UBX domain-containing protein 4 [Elysia marginata]|uniref:UBX domain-containing protein 4 n=1 Tax=Elysia marginata TaxID=1093978 RepID=A0AAV4FFQ1_9GAST|nr:UBX domain-containing protein 4 [Elysia marginata]